MLYKKTDTKKLTNARFFREPQQLIAQLKQLVSKLKLCIPRELYLTMINPNIIYIMNNSPNKTP
jgi:hypothetical protein